MDTDTDYLIAVAWMNAYQADPEVAVMIAQEFDAGRIGLEQAIQASVEIANCYRNTQ